MNKQLKSIASGLLFTGALVFTPAADAGFNIGLQNITEIAMANAPSSFAYVEFDGARNAVPSCSGGDPQNRRYAFDTSTNRGKALLSILTAAMYAQRPVYATGTGTCTSLTFGPTSAVSIENLQHVSAER